MQGVQAVDGHMMPNLSFSSQSISKSTLHAFPTSVPNNSALTFQKGQTGKGKEDETGQDYQAVGCHGEATPPWRQNSDEEYGLRRWHEASRAR